MEGLSTTEIIKKIPYLKFENFWYWVNWKAGIKAIGERRKGNRIIQLYPLDTVKIVKKILKERGK